MMTVDEIWALPAPCLVRGPSRPNPAGQRLANLINNGPAVDMASPGDLYLWDGSDLIDPHREWVIVDDANGPFTLVAGPVPPPAFLDDDYTENNDPFMVAAITGVDDMDGGQWWWRHGWDACRAAMGAPSDA